MPDQGWSLRESQIDVGIPKTPIFESPAYEEALSRLLFIIEQQRHCGILFGPVGAGKSLLLGQLSHIVRRASREIAFVDVHLRSGTEILWELCGELGLSPKYGDSSVILWRRILDHFLANRGVALPTVVVLDHADQGAEESVFLVSRLIHLASQGRGLSLILAIRGNHLGDLPEDFRDATDLRVELTWFDREQTANFVRSVFHSPADELPVFEDRAIDRLFAISQGAPRSLTHLCDLSLLAALAAGTDTVTERIVLSAATDLQISGGTPHRSSVPMSSSHVPYEY